VKKKKNQKGMEKKTEGGFPKQKGGTKRAEGKAQKKAALETTKEFPCVGVGLCGLYDGMGNNPGVQTRYNTGGKNFFKMPPKEGKVGRTGKDWAGWDLSQRVNKRGETQGACTGDVLLKKDGETSFSEPTKDDYAVLTKEGVEQRRNSAEGATNATYLV